MVLTHMQPLPDGYITHTTLELDRTLKKLKKTPIPQLVKEARKKLEVNPYHNTERLQDPRFSYYRRMWIGSHYRLYLGVCQECRQLKLQQRFKCPDCKDKTGNVVILIGIDPKSSAYERPPLTVGPSSPVVNEPIASSYLNEPKS
jgi:hypothetical protein